MRIHIQEFPGLPPTWSCEASLLTLFVGEQERRVSLWRALALLSLPFTGNLLSLWPQEFVESLPPRCALSSPLGEWTLRKEENLRIALRFPSLSALTLNYQFFIDGTAPFGSLQRSTLPPWRAYDLLAPLSGPVPPLGVDYPLPPSGGNRSEYLLEDESPGPERLLHAVMERSARVCLSLLLPDPLPDSLPSSILPALERDNTLFLLLSPQSGERLERVFPTARKLEI